MTRILVIDDDEKITASLKSVLTDNDYVVEVAHSVAMGIKRLEDQTFDVVLTDLYMPFGNGDMVIAHVRANLPNTRVILMSAHSYGKGHLFNEDAQLNKPFGVQELLDAIITVLQANGLAI